MKHIVKSNVWQASLCQQWTCWLVLVTLTVLPVRAQVIFFDDFGEASRGERATNIVQEPPPVGLGYPTDTPWGYRPKKWIVADEEPNGPRRGFWCLPVGTNGVVELYLRQAGRSHNSIAYAGVPVPTNAAHYTIEFKQWCNDNDYIGYIVGASQPLLDHNGIEFGYERQLPNTDQTVKDAYYRGALGTGQIAGQARMHQWVSHRIEVDGPTVRWFQDDFKMLEGVAPALRPGGYFGIRQRYERGTRNDDVRITLRTKP